MLDRYEQGSQFGCYLIEEEHMSGPTTSGNGDADGKWTGMGMRDVHADADWDDDGNDDGDLDREW